MKATKNIDGHGILMLGETSDFRDRAEMKHEVRVLDCSNNLYPRPHLIAKRVIPLSHDLPYVK